MMRVRLGQPQHQLTEVGLCPGTNQDAWRDKVRSPVVEDAWEVLCGSLLQEVCPAWLTFQAAAPADLLVSWRLAAVPAISCRGTQVHV